MIGAILSRMSWDAREPKSITYVDQSKRATFAVHYSGETTSQTVRSIQNFHMDTRGWADVGYNFLVDHTGAIFIGRGWDVLGAHILGHNEECIGVCFIGRNGDDTPVAREAIRWLYDQSTDRFGRALTMRVHRDLGSTDCPGDILADWVHAGMHVDNEPTPGGGGGGGGPAFPGRVLALARPLMHGEDVRAWQQRMRERGWRIAVDGVYGPESVNVATRFQVEKGLQVDGKVGPQTWAATWSAPVT